MKGLLFWKNSLKSEIKVWKIFYFEKMLGHMMEYIKKKKQANMSKKLSMFYICPWKHCYIQLDHGVKKGWGCR